MRRIILALVVALAACGDDDFNGLPDGPVQPDTNVDTPTSGLVKLTVTSGAVPQAGVKVHFQNSDSTLVASMVTDASGVASTVMEPGGFVTAIDPFPPIGLPTGVAPPVLLKTFAGVRPGDELVLHERDPAPPLVNFTFLANPEASGNVITYILFTPCTSTGGIVVPNQGAGSGGVTSGISISGCGATTDLTLVGFDTNGLPIAAIHATNIALSEGGTVDLTAEQYVATQGVTFAWTSVPANVGSVSITSLQATANGAQFELNTSALTNSGMAMTTAIPRPVIGGALQINATQTFGGQFGVQNVIDWGPSTTAYSLAMGNILTPTILLTEFSSLPSYDLTAKTVRWTVDAVGAQPDMIVANTRFQRDTPSFLQWEWDIASPAASPAEAVRYPVLPSPDDQLNPTVNDAFQQVNEVILAKLPGGYDAIRENVFAADDPASNIQGSGLVVGATGQVVFEEISLRKGKRQPPTAHGILSPFADRLQRAHGLRRR